MLTIVEPFGFANADLAANVIAPQICCDLEQDGRLADPANVAPRSGDHGRSDAPGYGPGGVLRLALLRRSPVKAASTHAGAFVGRVRATPLLVPLSFLFYVLRFHGITFSAPSAGIAALGLRDATDMSEACRAGIESVPHGQWEAAKAVGLRRGYVWKNVVLPHAMPAVFPAPGNDPIAMVKDAAVLSTITMVSEMLGPATTIRATAVHGLEPVALAGVICFPSVTRRGCWPAETR